MDIQNALLAFDALSQETRLRLFRLLVESGPDGVPAGRISEKLEIPHNTLSFHLSHMHHAGLVLSRRAGRSVIYAANVPFIRDLIRFMVEKCCSVDFARLHEDGKSGCSIVELAGDCPDKKKRK